MAQPARDRGNTDLTTSEQRLAADPEVGWRYWQLRPGGLLRSVTHRRIDWHPGQPLRARCLIGGHDAPAPGCACGIHAEPTLEALREQGLCMAPDEALVVGQVALWGTVVTDDHGLRAELASPRHLSLVTADEPPDAASLASLARYCVQADAIAPEDALGDVAAAILTFQSMSR